LPSLLGHWRHDRKIDAPVADAGVSSLSTLFLRTAAATAGGAAQLRGRENPSKIGAKLERTSNSMF
jgi:hypothetical protein